MTLPASSSPVKTDQIDVLVIGAGVVGLACARALAQAGLEVVITERETHFGTGVSSRSSEVIHAGLYNAPGSLKSRLCVRGGRLLVEYCASRGIAHRLCGKLLVATRAADIPALQRGDVGRARGHQQLAAQPVRDTAARAVLHQQSPAAHAQPRLQAARCVVEPGVNHLAAARGHTGAEMRLALGDHHLEPGLRQRTGTRQPDHAGTDDEHVDLVGFHGRRRRG